jgi:hypothetical protein
LGGNAKAIEQLAGFIEKRDTSLGDMYETMLTIIDDPNLMRDDTTGVNGFMKEYKEVLEKPLA